MIKPQPFENAYQSSTKLDKNAWITDPEVPDPDNLPEPLGFMMLIRPYPVKCKSSILIPETEIDYMNYITNIGRVVAIGPCCWNRSEQLMKDGTQKDWVQVGDFVSFPKNAGARRKFKSVSYVLVADDEITERLPDPMVFDNNYYQINIPDEHMSKYNTYKSQKKETE
jgi:co-chaperonin GroES (HSP10)